MDFFDNRLRFNILLSWLIQNIYASQYNTDMLFSYHVLHHKHYIFIILRVYGYWYGLITHPIPSHPIPPSSISGIWQFSSLIFHVNCINIKRCKILSYLTIWRRSSQQWIIRQFFILKIVKQYSSWKFQHSCTQDD